MSGSHTTIEELVMSSARGFLYGHPAAWDVPRGHRPSVAAPPGTRRRRLAAMLAARRGATANRAPVPVEAGRCG